jgi:O-antigen ligase
MNTTKILRVSIYILAVITTFLALSVANHLYFPYIVGKNFIFRIVVELMLALYVPLAYLQSEYRPKLSLGVGVYSIFMGVIFIADIFGVNPTNSLFSNFERMEGFVTHIHLFVFTLILIFIKITDIEWKRFFNISLLANAIVLVYAVADYINIAKANAHGAQLGTRLQTLLGNSEYLSIYCAFAVFTALILMVKKSQKEDISPLDFLYGLSIFVNLFVLWQTGTRGTVLGLIAGLIAAILWYGIQNRNNKKVRKITLFAIALFFGGILFFITNKESSLIQNNPTLKRIAGISLQDQTVRSRVLIWSMSWQGVKDRPLLGWGQENFIYVFAKEYNPEAFDQEQWFDRSHDVFFDWLIAAGIIGLVSYLAIFGATVWTLIENKQKRFSVLEQSVIIGLIATYFIHNIFVFDSTISYLSFFTLFAYIYSDYTVHKTKQKNVSSKGTGFWLITTSGILIAYCAFYYVVYKPYVLNKSIYQMLSTAPTATIEDLKQIAQTITIPTAYGLSEANEQLLNLTGAVIRSNAKDEDKKFFFELALNTIKQEIVQDSNNPRPPVLLASFAQSIGAHSLAIEAYNEALKRTPTKTLLWAEFAKELVAADKISEAEVAAAKAHTLSNRSVDAAVMYSAILLAEKKDQQALTVWKETIAANNYSADLYAKAAGFLQSRGGNDLVPSIIDDFNKKFPGHEAELIQYLENLKKATTTTQ